MMTGRRGHFSIVIKSAIRGIYGYILSLFTFHDQSNAKRTHTTLNLIEGKPSFKPILVQANNKRQQSLYKKKNGIVFDKFDKTRNKSVNSVSYLSLLSLRDLTQKSSR